MSSRKRVHSPSICDIVQEFKGKVPFLIVEDKTSMDKLLSAILASNSPDNVKQQFYQKIEDAGAEHQPADVVTQILYISSNMALGCDARSRPGLDIFCAWAYNHPAVMKDFMNRSFVLRLLDGRSTYAATGLELLLSCFQIMKARNINTAEYEDIVRSKAIGFIRETSDVKTMDVLLKLLLSHSDCVPTFDYWPTLCLSLIQAISRLPLPKDEADLVDFIKSVAYFAKFTHMLWSKHKSTLNRALGLILEIVSSKECEQEPSVALAAVIQLIPVDIIPEAVRSVLEDRTLDDACLTAALHRLVNWLGWITATNLPTWILAFLKALAGAKKYCILIMVTLTKVQVVFDCLRYQQLRAHTLPVLKLMLLSFQHSPQAFHKIAESIPLTVQLLRKENTSDSYKILLELNELTRTLMQHFSGFPDLYEPILEALKDLEEPCTERVKLLLSENKWSAQTAAQTTTPIVQLTKSETGKVGLDNLGNSCYVNSIIQAIYMCDELRCLVFASPAYSLQSLPGKLQQLFAFLKLSERASYCPRDFVTSSRPSWFLAGQQNDCSEYLKYLLDQLNEAEKSDRQITGKDRLKLESSFLNKTTSSIPMETSPSTSHGSTELPCAQSSAMEVETPCCSGLSKPEESTEASATSIEYLFMGKCETTITCLECGFQSCRSENFFDLPLAFPNSDVRSRSEDTPSLVGGNSSAACTTISEVAELAHGDTVSLEKLIHYYLQPEVLKDDNQYYCTQCDKLRDAERTVCITRAPRYLLLTLLRFSYDAKTQSRTKLLTDVSYPLSLVVATNQKHKAQKRKHDRIPQVEEPSQTFGYQLNSVVVHSGMSSDCGHYYTYARHLNESEDTTQQWYQFNDDRVTYASYESFTSLNRRFRLDTPYVLVYRRVGDDLGSDPEMDRILVTAVERDNAMYRQELEANSKKKVRFNLGPKGPFDKDEPSGGGCGLSGFPGLNGGARVVF